MRIRDSSPGPQPWSRDIGLVLPGGGARCAYQVGALKAIAELMPKRSPSPFPVISGTSAGAINSVVLATRARRFQHAVADMERVWGNFRTQQVFRSDSMTMLKTSANWLFSIVMGGRLGANPKSLLDNSPLRALLGRYIRFSHINDSIQRGFLDAIAVTAAGYGSARSISFYQGLENFESWRRVRRMGIPAEITLDHLMASVAAPLVFPPVQIDREYFGDGAMRQATPLSPAVRLGARRLLVIGVRNEEKDPEPGPDDVVPFPSFGRIAGYMLDALLMDGLSSDLERLARLNQIVNAQPGKTLMGDFPTIRSIDTMIMMPSQDVRDIALRHLHEMPRPVRILMRGLGALNYGGRQLVSYLLFESGYTRELIRLGYSDAMDRREQVIDFMQGVPLSEPSGVVGWRDLSDEYSQRLPILNIDEKAARA
ncbi:MAG: patatin-like phospholipase family protein [Gammaproteobacteria bacterium]|nr:patatin-like phospholipase family protein [Gammaproteobacteria bacterium]